MFHHYLKPALRKIARNKLYSCISILGLAVGMTAGLLIFFFVRYETGFDAMHPDAEQIYRLNWGREETNTRFATFYNPLAPIMAESPGRWLTSP